ncbi:unnamed protein product [Ilex paraguariensis]|uniref:Uncharacterized protein n=1 Tax=Ilex paraguariensis TaxID=185542 RepID=A0ABC8U3X8_9AQUA
MEGVGARLGRSSTRYGPATVFTGPVRKWKKKWVPVTPPNSNNHSQHQTAASNGNANGSNGSHLFLYKWTPISQSQNSNNNNNNNNDSNSNGETKNSGKDDVVALEEPPRRKFKYIPIAVLEDQKDEAAEQVETNTNATESTSKTDSVDEKPDINDVPMEENQAPESNSLARQDLNESTLDLSLGLNGHDGNNDTDSKTNQSKNGQL